MSAKKNRLPPNTPFAPVSELVKAIAKGKMVILVDDKNRENEGDLVMAAQFVTPEAINFMAKYGRGLICMPMTSQKLADLDIPMMVQQNTSHHGTAFTVSIEAKEGVTTGISAADRAHTILTAADDHCLPQHLAKPGHVFPLQAHDGGVLARAGHTEAIVDLLKITNLKRSGVLCEIMNDDGSMARLPELIKFANTHNMLIGTIADIIRHRLQKERLVHRITEADMPTLYADKGRVYVYDNEVDHLKHMALVIGDFDPHKPVVVRVHSECLTGDVFGSRRCDCGEQLDKAMRIIAREGGGVLLYLRQEGRGIGITNKIKAYALQDQGDDTVEANHRLGFKDDSRDYGIGVQILADLGIKEIRLITNNPKKIVGLVAREGFGMKIIERIPADVPANKDNLKYLRTKRDKMGHLLNEVTL